MPYIGNSPGTGTRNRFIYTATASQTTFSGADDNGKTLKYSDSDYVDVYLNGICLVPVTDYAASTKTSVVLTQAASLNDTLEVVAYDIATISDTVSKADGGTFEGDLGITSASPDLTFTNSTSEDTDGGRESTITFKGKQSGSEESTLAQIQASHDGTSDDQAGDLIIKVNDGNDGSSPSEVMRINSLGNVGIGTGDIDVSTQAGGSGYKALQIESDEGGQLNFDHNDAGTGSTLGQINFQRAGEVVAEMEGVTDGATDNGRLVFRTQPDGGALTERMRIDHDGNVGINDTAPDGKLSVIASGANGIELAPDSSLATDSSRLFFTTSGGSNAIFSSSGSLRFHTGSTIGSSSGTERMRLDGATGKFLIGTTTVEGAGHTFSAGQYNLVSGSTSTLQVVQFRNPNGKIGTIVLSGSSTAYNTSSDYRLKENVETLSGAITRVKALKPKRFSWIADEEDSANVDGFLAHEAATVVPEAVTGTKDEVEVWQDDEELPDGVSVGDNKLDADGNTIPEYQGIDQAKLVPLLTAALQEAIAKIETLETKVAALEAG